MPRLRGKRRNDAQSIPFFAIPFFGARGLPALPGCVDLGVPTTAAAPSAYGLLLKRSSSNKVVGFNAGLRFPSAASRRMPLEL
jgi:hypothetical protein